MGFGHCTAQKFSVIQNLLTSFVFIFIHSVSCLTKCEDYITIIIIDFLYLCVRICRIEIKHQGQCPTTTQNDGLSPKTILITR